MLLVGPPGTGKTHFVLNAVESAVREGRDRDVVLVVPTASMAEHLIHTLARRGVTVPTHVIRTIATYVEEFTPELREAEPAVESWLVDRLLQQAPHPTFREVLSRDGFREHLLATMREFMAAGCRPADLKPFAKRSHQFAFLELFENFQALLEENGYAVHGEKLLRAAERIRAGGLGEVREVYLDGFFQPSAGESALFSSLAQHAERFVAMVPADVEAMYTKLPVKRLKTVHRPRPRPEVVKARNPEHEVEDIARRILETKRPFHECGVVVRTPEVYRPLIETVFERFGIPFRMRAATSLGQHGAVAYIRQLLRGIAGGFDEKDLLALLGQQWCPAGLTKEADEYDFQVRKKLPGGGFHFLLRQADRFPKVQNFLKRLEALSSWSRERKPASVWARRVCESRQRLLRLPEITDDLSMPRVLDMRRAARALQGFEQAAAQAAQLWPESEQVGFADYFRGLTTSLDNAPLPVGDGRRNVVNVLSVYEARQWELTVVFVCGLIENQFPRHPTQNLFFSDADFRRMKGQGIPVRTLADREKEERLLFDTATTRATDSLVLTYPESDEGGRVNIRSFFIETPKDEDTNAPGVRVKETPADFQEPHQERLRVKGVKESMLALHGHFQPSAVETYLKCPFLFFGQHSLKLEGFPEDPEWRIDNLLAGTMVHETLRRWVHSPETPIADVLAEVFEDTCQRESIQRSFRTAVMFNNLNADLEAFAHEEEKRLGSGASERFFETPVGFIEEPEDGEPFQVRGRIDRYELLVENLALVVDYKYTGKTGMDKLAAAHEEGRLVQGALYLIGLEQVLGVKPAGIRYWGLRGGITRVGWISDELGGEMVEDRERIVAPEELRAMLERARQTTTLAVEEIRSGRMEADPYDLEPCRRYCEFRDICRIRP